MKSNEYFHAIFYNNISNLWFFVFFEDHADIDRAQVEQQAEIVEVAVVEWVFVIPFDFKINEIIPLIQH